MRIKVKLLSGMVAIVLLYSSSIFAQEIQTLPLDKAIEKGVQYNKNLVIGSGQLEEAKANVQAAKDARLPGFSVSSSYLRLTHANVDIQRKSTGTGTAPAENPSPNSALYGIANASYPIYTGGKLKYNLERANLLQKASELDLENTKENVTYAIVSAYAAIYKTGQMIKIIEENYQASLSRDSMMSNLEKNGIIARNDLLKSKLHTSELQVNLLEARSNNAVAISELNILMGQNENTPIQIDDNFSDSIPRMKTYDDFLTLAMQNRADKKSAGYKINAAASGIKVAKGEAYPELALTGGYIAADIPGVLKITNAINIGVAFKYNLSSIWKKNTSLAVAKARQTEATASADIINDNIKTALVADYQAFVLAQKKIALYEQTLEQANENYRITKNKYDNNLSTVNDLLDADVYVTQSKINKTLALAEEYLKYKKLQLTTGTL